MIEVGTTPKGRPFLLGRGVLEVEFSDGERVVIEPPAVLIRFWHGGETAGGWDTYKAPAEVTKAVREMLSGERPLDEVLDEVAEFVRSQFDYDWEWVSPCPWCYPEWHQWVGDE